MFLFSSHLRSSTSEQETKNTISAALAAAVAVQVQKSPHVMGHCGVGGGIEARDDDDEIPHPDRTRMTTTSSSSWGDKSDNMMNPIGENHFTDRRISSSSSNKNKNVVETGTSGGGNNSNSSCGGSSSSNMRKVNHNINNNNQQSQQHHIHQHNHTDGYTTTITKKESNNSHNSLTKTATASSSGSGSGGGITSFVPNGSGSKGTGTTSTTTPAATTTVPRSDNHHHLTVQPLPSTLHPIEMKARIRKRLLWNNITNVYENDLDLYGNGDQKHVLDPQAQLILHEIFYTGGDFNLLLQEYDWYELSRHQNVPVGSIRLNLGSLSEFAIHCIAGHYKIVKEIMEHHSVKRGKAMDALSKLLEKRETELRLTPLLMVIASNTRITTATLEDGSSTRMCSLPSMLMNAAAGGGGGGGNGDNYHQFRDNQDDDDNNYNTMVLMNQYDSVQPYQPSSLSLLDSNQIKVIKLLLEYGAKPDVKDVAGKTVVHYGAGVDATKMTLLAVDICIAASKSHFLFGREVCLRTNPISIAAATATATTTATTTTTTTTADGGTLTKSTLTTPIKVCSTIMSPPPSNVTLSKKQQREVQKLDGKMGIVHGYIYDTDCRIVYVFGHKKEIRTVRPYQLKLVHKLPNTEKPERLCNVPDRMGRVPLLEIYDTNRYDVAKSLLIRHKASIDVSLGYGTGGGGVVEGPEQQPQQNGNHHHTVVNKYNNHTRSRSKRQLSVASKGISSTSPQQPTKILTLSEFIMKKIQQQQSGILNKNSSSSSSNSNRMNPNQHNNKHRNNQANHSDRSQHNSHNDIHPIQELIYCMAIQSMKEKKRLERSQCSHCAATGTIQKPLRVCEPCMSVRFCSDECQLANWKGGHMYDCKHISRQRNKFVTIHQSSVIPGSVVPAPGPVSGTTNPVVSKGTFRLPQYVTYKEVFTVKVQYMVNENVLIVHDKCKECEFYVYAGGGCTTASKSRSSKTGASPSRRDDHGLLLTPLVQKMLTQSTSSSFGLGNQYPNQTKNKNNKIVYLNAAFDDATKLNLYFNQTKNKAW